MKISVVTVCFNEEKNIGRTIDSVLNQTSADFEYIICDGKSTDSSVKIAESYKDAFAAKGVDYIINSEKDKGIYDGMNKGIDIARGEYIYFLNAGDWFYSDDVIDKVINHINSNEFHDVIFGNVATVERNIVQIVEGKEDLYNNMTMCHQAVFVLTSHMKERKYNLDYKIMADYNFLLGLKVDGKNFLHIDETIAYFSVGGVSTVRPKRNLEDFFKIHESINHEITQKARRRLYYNAYRSMFSYKVKSAMPKKLWYWWSVKKKKKSILNEDE